MARQTATTDLYTAADLKLVREKLITEQGDICLLCDKPVAANQRALDHTHDETLLVRGVLHRQCNAFLGKLENAHLRLMSYWSADTLPELLEGAAQYLRRPPDRRYRHSAWLRKVNTRFGQLRAQQQDAVLASMGASGCIGEADKTLLVCSNAKQRKESFRKLVLSRKFSFEFLAKAIKSQKEIA